MELATAIGFSTELVMPILDAFAGLKVKGKRRKGQTYHPQRINFFHARRFDGWVGVRGCLPAKRPPKRKSPTIVLADLRWRQEAFTPTWSPTLHALDALVD